MKQTKLTQAKRFLRIFWYHLLLSLTTFGGGYVIVSVMRRTFVQKLHWITDREMLDYTALAQTAPGSIAINASILIGQRMAGLPGILCAMVGTVLPPFVILTAVTYCYNAVIGNPWVGYALRGLQAGVTAILLEAVIAMVTPYIKGRQFWALGLMVLAFLLSRCTGINVAFLLLGTALLGLLYALWRRRKEGRT